MSRYVTFHNKNTDKKLIFYPCPKNANTSAKLFFAKHVGIDKKYLFLGDQIPQKNQRDELYTGKKNIISFLPSKQPFEKREVDFKCCLVRDPIKRFISAYKNRILYHGDPEFNNHTIDMILTKLENNNFENKHFLPQSYFLGESLDYYSFWTFVEESNIFAEKVNDFFQKQIEFPAIQTGGKQFKVNLTKMQTARIEKIYLKDYKLINK